MPAKKRSAAKAKKDSTANIGFEAKLWLAANKLRNNMDAAEYQHVVLGLIFLEYISDTFQQHHAKLVAGEGDYEGAIPEDQDEYKAENIFWAPKEGRWSHLQANAKQPTIGKTVDDAMVAIERHNPRLKGVLPKDYARPGLDKHRLGTSKDSAMPSESLHKLLSRWERPGEGFRAKPGNKETPGPLNRKRPRKGSRGQRCQCAESFPAGQTLFHAADRHMGA